MAKPPKFAIAEHGNGVAESAPAFAVRHYSPSDLAQLWNLSADTVRRMFENEPGVLVFENPERESSRRRRTLRIPESVAERVYRRLCTRGRA